jgi:hypothetical protein
LNYHCGDEEGVDRDVEDAAAHVDGPVRRGRKQPQKKKKIWNSKKKIILSFFKVKTAQVWI